MSTIKIMQKWRYVLSTILLFCLSCNMFHYCQFQLESVSLTDLILFQTDDKNTICFSLLFVFILYCWDLENKNSFLNTEKSFAYSVLKKSLVNSCIFVGFFLLTNIFAYIVLANGEYSYFETSVLSWSYNPLICLSESMVLIFFRFSAVAMITCMFNCFFKQSWGGVIIIFLTFFDYNFYYYSQIDFPLYITPVEHTLITFDTMSFSNNIKFNNLISVGYWIIILIIVYVLLDLITKQKARRSNYEKTC